MFRIVKGNGMGGFLNPPGNAEHTYHVAEFRGGHEVGSMSLSYAAGSKTTWVPADIKQRAAEILAEYPGLYTEEWERQVYTHLHHCYNEPGSKEILIFPVPSYKHADEAELARAATVAIPENHAAYTFIRRFFPDAKPRLDLMIEDPRGVSNAK